MQRKCQLCNKLFLAKNYQVKIGGAKFCSRLCANKVSAKSGDRSPTWTGNKVGYMGIHHWLKKNFGKANKCENSNCLNLSKKFEWAKLKSKGYQRKRENFIRLCRRCHMFYDGLIRGGWNKGIKNPYKQSRKIN